MTLFMKRMILVTVVSDIWQDDEWSLSQVRIYNLIDRLGIEKQKAWTHKK